MRLKIEQATKLFALSMVTVMAVTVVPYATAAPVVTSASVSNFSYIRVSSTQTVSIVANRQTTQTVNVADTNQCVINPDGEAKSDPTSVQDPGAINFNDSANCFRLSVGFIQNETRHLSVRSVQSHATVSVARQNELSADRIANPSSDSGNRTLPPRSVDVENAVKFVSKARIGSNTLIALYPNFLFSNSVNLFQVLRC